MCLRVRILRLIPSHSFSYWILRILPRGNSKYPSRFIWERKVVSSSVCCLVVFQHLAVQILGWYVSVIMVLDHTYDSSTQRSVLSLISFPVMELTSWYGSPTLSSIIGSGRTWVFVLRSSSARCCFFWCVTYLHWVKSAVVFVVPSCSSASECDESGTSSTLAWACELLLVCTVTLLQEVMVDLAQWGHLCIAVNYFCGEVFFPWVGHLPYKIGHQTNILVPLQLGHKMDP